MGHSFSRDSISASVAKSFGSSISSKLQSMNEIVFNFGHIAPTAFRTLILLTLIPHSLVKLRVPVIININ